MAALLDLDVHMVVLLVLVVPRLLTVNPVHLLL